MRILVEVGDAKAEVDVGKTIERGLNRLEEMRREAVDGVRRRMPNRDDVIASINGVIKSRWGLQLGPAEPAAAAPGSRQPSRPAPPKRRPHQKKRR